MKKALIALGIIFLIGGLLNVFLMGAYLGSEEKISTLKWIGIISNAVSGVAGGVLMINIASSKL